MLAAALLAATAAPLKCSPRVVRNFMVGYGYSQSVKDWDQSPGSSRTGGLKGNAWFQSIRGKMDSGLIALALQEQGADQVENLNQADLVLLSPRVLRQHRLTNPFFDGTVDAIVAGAEVRNERAVVAIRVQVAGRQLAVGVSESGGEGSSVLVPVPTEYLLNGTLIWVMYDGGERRLHVGGWGRWVEREVDIAGAAHFKIRARGSLVQLVVHSRQAPPEKSGSSFKWLASVRSATPQRTLRLRKVGGTSGTALRFPGQSVSIAPEALNVFGGTAPDGYPVLVSQFPLAPGATSLLSAGPSACSLADKASMPACLETATGGRPRGVPPSFTFWTGSRAEWAAFSRWVSVVESQIRAGELPGYRTTGRKWLVKDCAHRKSGLGVVPATEETLRGAVNDSLTVRQGKACATLQWFMEDSLLLPWADAPIGQGRRFMLRFLAAVVSLKPAVVYVNLGASEVWMSSEAVPLQPVSDANYTPGRRGLVSSWKKGMRRPYHDLIGLARNVSFANGRWRLRDVRNFPMRVARLLSDVVKTQNASAHRTGSFAIYGCDLLVATRRLEPVLVECGAESSRGDKYRVDLDKIPEMFRVQREGKRPEACPTWPSQLGEWLRFK
eukprot:Hpha_TRINITY_DN17313_c0_g1::TRINITY_DN17313_c0_g1_i1::g.137844::m.137844